MALDPLRLVSRHPSSERQSVPGMLDAMTTDCTCGHGDL